MEGLTTTKKTLLEWHEEVAKYPATIREKVKEKLNLKSDVSFYQVLKGNRKLNLAEKDSIAAAYNTTADNILWPDETAAPLLVP